MRCAGEEELGAIGLVVGARVEEGRALCGVEGVERLEVLALEREQAVGGDVLREFVSFRRQGLGSLRRFAGREFARARTGAASSAVSSAAPGSAHRRCGRCGVAAFRKIAEDAFGRALSAATRPRCSAAPRAFAPADKRVRLLLQLQQVLLLGVLFLYGRKLRRLSPPPSRPARRFSAGRRSSSRISSSAALSVRPCVAAAPSAGPDAS